MYTRIHSDTKQREGEKEQKKNEDILHKFAEDNEGPMHCSPSECSERKTTKETGWRRKWQGKEGHKAMLI